MITGFLFALSGFFSLALAMNKHHHQMRRKNPAPVTRLVFRIVGALGLTLSLFACAQYSGWPVGTVLWCGLLTATALLVAMFFTYGPVHKR